MDTGQRTESLLRLVEDIKKKAVTLPEFQRDFVWDVEKTYDLFDSFVRDIFTGSLIYGVPSFEISVRELDVRPRSGVGSRKKLEITNFTKSDVERLVKTSGFRLLLDGQQRATSIYRALIGVDKVFMRIKRDQVLHPDVLAIPPAKRELEGVLEEFSGSAGKECVSILMEHVYRMTQGEFSREVEKASLAADYPNFAGMSVDEVQKSLDFEIFLTQSKNLENLFRQEKLVSYYLLDTDAEKFALFFERSNSKGLQLDFIDILAAKLYVGFNLRHSIESFEEESKGLRLFREGVVRVISYIVSNGKETGRAYILSSLGHTEFTEHWDNVTKLYRRCYEFLFDNRWVIHQDWMPYGNMIIPMILFLRKIPKQSFANADSRQIRVLSAWWWSSIFSRRYSSAAQTYVLEDAKFLEEIAASDFSGVNSYFEKMVPIVRKPDDLLSVHKKYDALYKGVFNAVHHAGSGLVGLFNGSKLSWSDELEDHHVFPKKYLNALPHSPDVEWKARIDCVVNRTLVPKSHNLIFGGRKPSEYLSNSVPGTPTEKEYVLKEHLIPADLLSGALDDKYEEFLAQRADEIFTIIQENIRYENI